MSATTNPPGPIGMVRVGTDLRDLGREINRVIAALNATLPIVRNLCAPSRKPGIPPPSLVGVSRVPTTVGVNGVAATITGSYSSGTPYLWIDYAANTAEWKASTISPFPSDTIILNGAAGYGSEYWVLR